MSPQIGLTKEQLAQLQKEEDEYWDSLPEKTNLPTWSMEEIENHPFFMTSIPQDQNEIDKNPHLKALQSIIYDDESPEGLAESFKERGNEFYKQGSQFYQGALKSYTKGIEQNCKNDKVCCF